ncbi:dipeptidase [bacterium]|nr:MAG: dipeptidase [bacterium]
MKDLTESTASLLPIPIQESGEPLVRYRELSPDLIEDRPRFHYRREPYAREGLAVRLGQANAWLMEREYRLLILECWRPPFIQRRMFQAVEADLRQRFPDLEGDAFRALVEQYSAPMDPDVPPPHTTGGAVDLWLGDREGNELDLTSPYEWRDPAGFAFDAPGLSETARKHRELLAEALVPLGVTNYPSEYWHWSYGDQGWAYRGDHSHAIYGAVQPIDWVPAPGDDIDGPLVFIEKE